MSTFEIPGCGLMVIAGERENTYIQVVVSLVPAVLLAGKDRKSLLTLLLQQGSFSLLLVTTSNR